MKALGLTVTWRKNWRFWLGVSLSLVCLIWLMYSIDLAGVGTALMGMDYRLVFLATLLNLANVLLRTVRWRLIFHTPHPPPFGRLASALLIGQSINILAPARLGDLVRATLVGAGSTAYVLGTLVVELGLDLLMSAALVVLLLSRVTLPAWWRQSGQALLIAAAATLVAVGALVVGRRWIARVLEGLQSRWRHPLVQRVLTGGSQILRSLDALRGPALLPVLTCSALIWAMYAAVNYALLGAVGERPSVLAALFVLVVLLLGSAIPSSPGRIGVYHYLCIQALAVFGIGGAPALSYAIVLHLISVVMPIVLGVALAWRLGVSLRPSHETQMMES